MDKKMFNELVESLKEMDAIAAGNGDISVGEKDCAGFCADLQ